MYQTDPPLSPKITLPTMYDLPSENQEEPGLPDSFHIMQPRLLDETFKPKNYPFEEYFTATDMNLYYDVHHTGWYKRPDWFAVVGVAHLYNQHDLRLSYVIWQEGVIPLIVVELLSPGTEKEDLGKTLRDASQPPTKWEVYQNILRIPYYVVFDRYTDNLRIFQLQGTKYLELTLSERKFWLEEIELGIGIWEGTYQGITRKWLRFYDSQNNWIPTPEERAETAEQELIRLRQLLEQAGVNPEQ